MEAIATLESGSIVVWDKKIASILYSNGFFGKPLGLRKTKPGLQYRPLVLSPFEAMYLLEFDIIKVKYQNDFLNTTAFNEICIKLYDEFERKYNVYSDLRKKGYVVRPGMKFGSDFIVYEKGPGFDHSKWVVHVEKDETLLKAINVVRAGRLAASVKKRYLISTMDNNKQIIFYGFDREKI